MFSGHWYQWTEYSGHWALDLLKHDTFITMGYKLGG